MEASGNGLIIKLAQPTMTSDAGFVSGNTPLFHVSLGDGDEWLVEVEWPDAKLERIRSFKNCAKALNWVTTQSEQWLRTHDIFVEQPIPR
jgi:hypothetical protein